MLSKTPLLDTRNPWPIREIFLFIEFSLFALLYLGSDSTTVPLADAKLSGPRDAFEMGC